MMKQRTDSEPYALVLRRGRITLLSIIVLIAISEIAIVALTLALRGPQTIWRLGFGAVLTFVLLRALYKGYDAARWFTVLIMGLLSFLLILTATTRDGIPVWARLMCAVSAGVDLGVVIVLIRSRPVREFMARATLRRFAADRIFDKDGIRRFGGRMIEEWLRLAASPDAALRLEAVKGLRYVLEDVESSECERALLGLAEDSEEPVRYDAISALGFGKNLIRLDRPLAIKVLRSIRSQALPEGAELFMTAEDPDSIKEYFQFDNARLEAAARCYHLFENAGSALRNLGVDPNPPLGPSAPTSAP
jgi:hypothetical protein